jgi:hypothetical protein
MRRLDLRLRAASCVAWVAMMSSAGAATVEDADSWAFAIGNGHLNGDARAVGERLGEFDAVVIDGEEARAADVTALHGRGATVLGCCSPRTGSGDCGGSGSWSTSTAGTARTSPGPTTSTAAATSATRRVRRAGRSTSSSGSPHAASSPPRPTTRAPPAVGPRRSRSPTPARPGRCRTSRTSG